MYPIIGIDLALSNTGVAILWENDDVAWVRTIQTTPKTPLVERSKELYSQLWDLILAYPEATIAVEVPSGSQSAHAAKALSAATAVLGCLMYDYGQPMYNWVLLDPRHIKALVGQKDVKGPARKALNIAEAERLYPNAPFRRNSQGEIFRKCEHEADALLLAHIARKMFE